LVLEQANITLGKPSARLQLAGAGIIGPILSGLKGRFTVFFNDGETFTSGRVFTSTGFNNVLSWEVAANGATADVVFGVDTATSAAGVRNFIEWVTNRGTSLRQFFVKNLPAANSVYIDNQEAQGGEAVVFINNGDPDVWARRASFAINIMPAFNDEFFTQQEFVGNRFANTLRNWGGAATAQVFLDGVEIISERAIEDVHGYFWLDPIAYGIHAIKVRLRSVLGSSVFVDVHGSIRARQIPCD